MLIDRQAGDENGQVKIDAGETGQAERDTERLSCPRGNYADARRRIVTRSIYRSASLTDCRREHPASLLHLPAMLDIRLIREQPDFVKSRLATRGGDDAAQDR